MFSLRTPFELAAAAVAARGSEAGLGVLVSSPRPSDESHALQYQPQEPAEKWGSSETQDTVLGTWGSWRRARLRPGQCGFTFM